jgi:hypothetical protein
MFPKPIRTSRRRKTTAESERKAIKREKADIERTACRLAVVTRDGWRSRMTRRPLTLATGHVHELQRRSQGGSVVDTRNCIALLPQEHDFFTWNYVACQPLDPERGAEGPVRWVLLPAGERLLHSSGTRRRWRDIWVDIWNRKVDEWD